MRVTYKRGRNALDATSPQPWRVRMPRSLRAILLAIFEPAFTRNEWEILLAEEEAKVEAMSRLIAGSRQDG